MTRATQGRVSQRLAKNSPGKYYTIDDCDGCAYCAAVAPDNFEFDKSTNTYFIGRQPANQNEEEVVREAQEDCPVDAVRVEGDEPVEEESAEAEYVERELPD